MRGWFVVARNPDEDSSLPYPVKFPLGSRDVVLKAKETWPRTAKVYCHRAEWPPDAEILEEVPVISCQRRGPAVDIVLERSRENRSQLVFIRVKGREAIFWQTARTVRRARPGVRVPTRRASGLRQLRVLVDSQEKYPYRFSRHQATTARQALGTGDYAVEVDDQVVAAVERKSLVDLAHSLSDGSLAFTLSALAALPRAAVVVEDRYSALLKSEHAPGGWLADVLARLQARYPVPIVFCETRPLAEDWTYRFLGACLADHSPGE